MSNSIPEANWKWFGHAGHLCVGQWCRFHVCTLIGDYLVSTVGEYWPERACREIHAEIHDPQWLVTNRHLKGDYFDAAYMKRFGYETIGSERLYETMVFRATGGVCESKECGCGLPNIETTELDFEGYNDAKAANLGHLRMCQQWASAKYREERLSEVRQ